VIVREARRLIRFTHEYSDRKVTLDTWRIDSYDGQPESREGQALRWMKPSALTGLDVLPTVVPAVAALILPAHYVFTPLDATADFLLAGLDNLPRGALLRLRQPALNDADYARLAGRLAAPCRSRGIGLMLDRAPGLVTELGVAGWHVTEARLGMLEAGPSRPHGWIAASVHGADALVRAGSAGADFAVLGPIRETTTHPGTVGIGWAGFERIIDVSTMPVYAIGGLGPGQLYEAQSRGAQGIAGIRAYWSGSASSGDSGASVFSSGSA